MRASTRTRPTAWCFRSAGIIFAVFGILLAGCTDSNTQGQLTGVAPGDRFEKVVPDQVGDLSARSLNHKAVELTWTQVQDGRGMPAHYQVRVLDGLGGWDQAATVATGSCEYPVRGVAVGTSLTCVVDGLEAERDYRFFVGAERSDNEGLVVGAPSQATAVLTREAPRIRIPAVAEMVSGLTYEGTVGQALQRPIEVVFRDSLGAPIAGVPVIWASGAGGGMTAGPVSFSDANGRARTVWTLGPQAGTQTLSLQVEGMADTELVAEAATGPVDQIRITVDTLVMGVGDRTSFAVRGWDEFGNEVEELPVEWETSNSQVVAVDSRGEIRSEAWGWVLIRAWVLDLLRQTKTEDTAVVLVEADPGAIADLAIQGVGEDWMTLAWDEVDDGTGQAASYEVRVGRAGSGWSQATAASGGSCASAAGSAIGARFTCTVTGLDADRQHDLFVRAYRLKNGARVYGSEASVSGRTLAVPSVPAGVNAESGVNQTGTVGARLADPVVVRVVDQNGAALQGAAVHFDPSDDGQVSASRVVTDSRGRATVRWTLGTRAGLQSLSTTLEPPTGSRSGRSAAPSTPVTISATARAGAAATLTVTPSSLHLQEGETSTLTVRASDAHGNPTGTSGAEWQSMDSGVATVARNGGVQAVAGGETTVGVRVGDAVATATVTVEMPDPPAVVADPQRITDVRVVSTTETSLVVEYTEVDDGSGAPALAQLRLAYSPIRWGWGQASVVEEGNCASPIVGNGVGSTRQCVIEGLHSDTRYDVQMVSWRVTDGGNLHAPLSNVATGHTSKAAAPPQGPVVAKVVTSPTSFNLDVGRSYPLTAVAYDSRDRVVSTPISWSSSNSAVATVASDGTVRAVGAGTAMLIATALCCTEADTSYVTVNQTQQPPLPPPPSGQSAWYVQDWNFSSVSNMLADRAITNATLGGGSLSVLSGLTGTPGGFTNAVRIKFDANWGREPQVGVDITLPNADRDKPREIWVEFHVRWSPNWITRGPNTGNADHKFFFLFDQDPSGARRWESHVGHFGDGIGTFIAGSGRTEYYQPGIEALWDGKWHRFRYHAKMDRNGVWDVEIDGQKFAWEGNGTNTDFGSQYYFKYVALSRNLNRGTDRDMTLDFGPVSVYTSNPGWE